MITTDKKENNKDKKKIINDNNNPYLTSKRTWNDYISSEIGARKLWQVVALGSLACCFLSITGIAYIGAQSKFTPYIIEVDKLGRSQFAGVIPNYPRADSRVVNVMLTDFINDLRTVSLDTAYQLNMINRVYAKIENTEAAATKVSTFYQEHAGKNNPFNRVKYETVSVEVTSILNQTEQTFQLEWEETIRNLEGKVLRKEHYRAIITIYFLDNSNTSFDKIQKNPIGIYIKDYDIQKLKN